MKRLRTLKTTGLALAVIMLSIPARVYATNSTGVPTIPNPTRFDTLEDIINTVGVLVRPVVIIAFIIVVMYGGWVRLTARDNADKIALSWKIIASAAIGFAIVVLAPVIVDFVGSVFGVQGGLSDLNSNV